MLEKDTGKNILLATEAPTSTEGTDLAPIQYADDLAIASDGSIYFTDACDIPTALNAAGFYDTMASFILAAFQVHRHPMFLLLHVFRRPWYQQQKLVRCSIETLSTYLKDRPSGRECHITRLSRTFSSVLTGREDRPPSQV